jgi:hypothetical protein
MKARIFIPEFEVPKVLPGAEVSLKLESEFRPLRGKVTSMTLASSPIEPGLISEQKYKGIAPPAYYVATAPFANIDGAMRPGMSGDAKINIRRLSVAGFVFENLREFTRRKIW